MVVSNNISLLIITMVCACVHHIHEHMHIHNGRCECLSELRERHLLLTAIANAWTWLGRMTFPEAMHHTLLISSHTYIHTDMHNDIKQTHTYIWLCQRGMRVTYFKIIYCSGVCDLALAAASLHKLSTPLHMYAHTLIHLLYEVWEWCFLFYLF